jgi:hypothetical protein
MPDLEPGTIEMISAPQLGDDQLPLEFNFLLSEPVGIVDPWITVGKKNGPGERPIAVAKYFFTDPSAVSGSVDIIITGYAPGYDAILDPLKAGVYVIRIISGDKVLAQGTFDIA